MDVIWRDAKHPDRSALQSFECTAMPRAKLTGNFKVRKLVRKQVVGWAHEAQGAVRSLEPPVRLPNVIEVVVDSMGIAAVYFLERLKPSSFFLKLVAVRTDVQSQGLGGMAVERAVERAAVLGAQSQLTSVRIAGNVHDKNVPSIRMLERSGWSCVGNVFDDYSEWVVEAITPFGAPGLELDF